MLPLEQKARRRRAYPYRALLRKNFSLQKRQKGTNCCQIFTPVLVMIILVILQLVSPYFLSWTNACLPFDLQSSSFLFFSWSDSILSFVFRWLKAELFSNFVWIELCTTHLNMYRTIFSPMWILEISLLPFHAVCVYCSSYWTLLVGDSKWAWIQSRQKLPSTHVTSSLEPKF